MGSLMQEKLINKKKELIDAETALKGKVIALYFSAHWCPPCRQFTPKLKKFYDEVKKAGKPFEIVFVSWDRSKDDMWQYFSESHGDYYALPYECKLRESLGQTHGVSGIPWMTIIKENGTAVRNEADEDLAKMSPIDCFNSWEAACK